jgi:hypothetical protein
MLRRESRIGFPFSWIVWASAVLMLSGCSVYPRVHATYERAEDWSPGPSASYAWASERSLIDPSAVGWLSPLDDRRIRAAVDARLAARGWRRLEDVAQADWIIVFTAMDRVVMRYSPTPGADSLFFTNYGPGTGTTATAYRGRPGIEGMFSIQMYDPNTRRPVWTGWGLRRFPASMDRQEVIDRVVGSIIEGLPPAST